MSHPLAQRLPDVPRWVEARSSLLWNRCEISGLREHPELSFVARDPATELVTVVGTPDLDAVEAAVRRNARGGSLLAPLDRAARLTPVLPTWHARRAILHLPGPSLRLPVAASGRVRFLDPDALDRLRVPRELLRDLRIGAEHSPIAATFVDDEPVSFCYAGAVTESLWDVSIDTLPDHRRHGYAALCAAFMTRHLRREGRQPVWGAVEDNRASRQLARKLGFVPVDALAFFEPEDGERDDDSV